MTAYAIDYSIRNTDKIYSTYIDAKDMKSAKKKIGRKHGYKTGNMVQIKKVIVCGYY